MSFFFGDLICRNQMVAGVREGVSKQNKPYLTITVVDGEGNTNTLSTTEPDTMAVCRDLKQGEMVDLTIVCAGGPNKQYAMLARGVNSVRPASGNLGY